MLDRVLTGLTAVPFLLGAAAAPVDHAHEVFAFQDDAIVESSGLVVVPGLVVTTNDSGDTGRVFAVDPATGRTVSETHWEDDPTDVEALAPDGKGGVWVGDIGDNTETRDTVQVADVPVTDHDATVHPTVYDLAYPDGPHNAETLVTDPTTGRLYVATKEVLGGTLYAAPAHLSADHVNRLRPVGNVLPIATDGTFLAGGDQLVIRNYGEAVLYAFPSLEKLREFRLPRQHQGEGIALEPDGRLLLSSEGLHSSVLEVDSPQPRSSPSSRTTLTVEGRAPTSSSSQVANQSDRPGWPWFLGGLVGLGCLAVLVRSLRPR